MGVFEQPVRPFSLNPGIGVTEDDPTVGAGLDQVTASLISPPSLSRGYHRDKPLQITGP